MINIMNWYAGNSKKGHILYAVDFVVFFVLTILMIIGLMFFSLDLKILIVALWLADLFFTVLFVLLLFANSYYYQEDSIIVFDRYKKKKYKIGDIPSIVITNNIDYAHGVGVYVERVKNRDRKRVSCPMIILMDQDVRWESVSLDHPMKNWDIAETIKKNSKEAKTFYAFIANKKTFSYFEKYFRGKIYIARTVYENFKVEISEIYSRWEYDGKAINIIQDRNSKKDSCNSPYLDLV